MGKNVESPQPLAANPADRRPAVELIKWDESLSVHVPELDSQHLRLINMINELHVATAQGQSASMLRPLLGRLVQYTVTHFYAEERYMQQIQYAHFTPHQAEHEKFRRKVQELADKLNVDGPALAPEAMRFLRDWLTNHIQRVDRQYSPNPAYSGDM
jgi:hemerythrin